MPKRDLAHHAGKFAKHVLPAAVKPIHSLWHEIIGFVFLSLAAFGLWKMLRNTGSLGPVQMSILGVFIAIMVIYGVASFLKARRISRS